LKGIYPRDPTNKNKGMGQTYYLMKDILFLSHDPMLEQMRLHKTWKKRLVKAKGRKEKDKVKHLERVKPQLEIDHVIRERYGLSASIGLPRC
jgi:pescadillo protein